MKTAANKKGKGASKPTIGEIKTVLEDHIHTLITSFSEFGPKDRGLVARKGIDAAASIDRCPPEIQREIACLQRAIELLDQNSAWETCPRCKLQCVPRGTPANLKSQI